MPLPDAAADDLARRFGVLVATLARAQFARLMRAIQAGDDAAKALADSLAGFTGGFADSLAEAFSELLQRSVFVKQVLALPVGGLTLSQHLYQHRRRTQAEALDVIRRHARGVIEARRLALELYDGYTPQDGIKRPLEGSARASLPRFLRELTEDATVRRDLDQVLERGQAQAARVKSAALRAAYVEALAAWEKGAAPEALQRRIDVAVREKNRYFANRIAQTELARAHQAQAAAEFMADPQVEILQVVMNPQHPKTDICDLHARANLFGLGPGLYPKARAPRPPFHPHCLPGDTLVSATGRITAVSKRWFEGDVAVIATAGGKRLTATVNHPVLTRRGWVAAGALNVRDEVVCRVGPVPVGDSSARRDDEHQDVPASISEVVDAFLSAREVSSREVPGSAEDFHGDGMAGEVTVVGAHRELSDRVDAATAQLAHDAALSAADVGPGSLLGDRHFDFGREGLGHAADGVMSGGHHGGSSLRSHALEADEVLLPLAADGHAGFDEPLGDSWASDAQLARQIQDGATGAVFADQVVHIERHSFAGHVFNLETESGHFTCNNIVTHNCWCKLRSRPSLNGARWREVPRGEAAFLRGLPAGEAAKVMGSRERAARVLDGAGVANVVNAGKDPMYRLVRVGQGTEHPLLDNDRVLKLPNAENAVVPPQKLVDYVLNPANAVGAHKARVFASALGFTAANAADLAEQLRAGVAQVQVSERPETRFGRSFSADIPVTGPRGSGMVRTGWFIDVGSEIPRLVSAYVLTGK